jgi:hypothetical protein
MMYRLVVIEVSRYEFVRNYVEKMELDIEL